jgi:uncharacterized membrane protein YfcA
VKAVLILIAVLAGFILAQLGLPASFLTGPLLVARRSLPSPIARSSASLYSGIVWLNR